MLLTKIGKIIVIETKDRFKMKNKSKLPIFVAIFLCGLVISACLSYAIYSGLLVKWTELPKAPEKPIEIVGAEYGKVYIETTDGYFGCELYSKNATPCWSKIDWPISLHEDPYLQECRTDWSLVLPPPGKVVDQEDIRLCLTEGWNHQIFVLTENGSVLVWEHAENALSGLFIVFIGTCLGTVLFLSFSIIFLFLKNGLTRKLKNDL